MAQQTRSGFGADGQEGWFTHDKGLCDFGFALPADAVITGFAMAVSGAVPAGVDLNAGEIYLTASAGWPGAPGGANTFGCSKYRAITAGEVINETIGGDGDLWSDSLANWTANGAFNGRTLLGRLNYYDAGGGLTYETIFFWVVQDAWLDGGEYFYTEIVPSSLTVFYTSESGGAGSATARLACAPVMG